MGLYNFFHNLSWIVGDLFDSYNVFGRFRYYEKNHFWEEKILARTQIRTQIPRSHFPRFVKSYLRPPWSHRHVSPLVRKLLWRAFLRVVKHVCAIMESGDINNIRLNKRGKWDRGIRVRGIWVLASGFVPKIYIFDEKRVRIRDCKLWSVVDSSNRSRQVP